MNASSLHDTRPSRPVLFISPAEPGWLKERLATVFELESSVRITESRGVDIAWRASSAWWGLQRKTVDDLIASIGDRLTREVAQMTGERGVAMPHVIVEGQVRFTADGHLIRDRGSWGQQFTRKQWRGLMWSMQHAGVSVSYAPTRGDTVEMVCDLYAWSQKPRHQSLRSRVGAPKNDWGVRGSREWNRWVLQSFDGIGPDLADAILDHFGELPMTWTVGVDELLQVKGLGRKRAGRLVEMLAAQDSMGGA